MQRLSTAACAIVLLVSALSGCLDYVEIGDSGPVAMEFQDWTLGEQGEATLLFALSNSGDRDATHWRDTVWVGIIRGDGTELETQAGSVVEVNNESFSWGDNLVEASDVLRSGEVWSFHINLSYPGAASEDFYGPQFNFHYSAGNDGFTIIFSPPCINSIGEMDWGSGPSGRPSECGRLHYV